MESLSPLKSHLDRTQSIESVSPTVKKTSDFSTEARTTMLHRLEEYKKSNFKLDAAENFLKQKQEAKITKQQNLEKIAITVEDSERLAIFSAEKEQNLNIIKEMGTIPEKPEVVKVASELQKQKLLLTAQLSLKISHEPVTLEHETNLAPASTKSSFGSNLTEKTDSTNATENVLEENFTDKKQFFLFRFFLAIFNFFADWWKSKNPNKDIEPVSQTIKNSSLKVEIPPKLEEDIILTIKNPRLEPIQEQDPQLVNDLDFLNNAEKHIDELLSELESVGDNAYELGKLDSKILSLFSMRSNSSNIKVTAFAAEYRKTLEMMYHYCQREKRVQYVALAESGIEEFASKQRKIEEAKSELLKIEKEIVTTEKTIMKIKLIDRIPQNIQDLTVAELWNILYSIAIVEINAGKQLINVMHELYEIYQAGITDKSMFANELSMKKDFLAKFVIILPFKDRLAEYIKCAKAFNLEINPESVLAKEIYSEDEIGANIYIKYGAKASQYAEDIRFKEVTRLNKASAQYINLLYPLLNAD